MEMCEQEFFEFKRVFIEVASEEFFACKNFIEQIERCQSILMMKQTLIHFADEIFDRLGGEADTSHLDDEIEQLKDKIELLEENENDLDELFPTLYDEMKFNTFKELHSKYTPWEFEQLLINGKL